MKCVIPARGGSKRIPNKNFKEMNGIPLFMYSVNIAKKSGLFDEVIVTTDVDLEGDFTVHKRDKVSDEQTLQEVWDMFEKPICCILPNPLTRVEDLIEASKIDRDVWSCVEPEYNRYEDAGQFYFIRGKRKVLFKVKEAVDINTPEDWEEANEILNNRRYRQFGSKVS